MNRLTHATRAANLFGAGKDGYTDGVPTITPATILNSVAMNPIQEELARAVEAFTTLDAGNLGQLATILTTITQDVPRTAADVPVFGSTKTAHDHPSSASNIWKLLVEGAIPGNRWARLYVGDHTVAEFAITTNAKWHPASADQFWTQDNVGEESNIFQLVNGSLFYQGKAPGAGNFTTWDATRGNLGIGDTVTAGKLHSTATGTALTVDHDALVSGNAVVSGTLHVTAVGTALTVDHDALIGGDAVVTGTVTAGHFHTANDYDFTAPKSRVTHLRTLDVQVNTGTTLTIGSGLAIIASAGGDKFRWTISLPDGAVLSSAQVMVEKAGSSIINLHMYRKNGYNFANGVQATPNYTTIGTGAITGGAVNIVNSVGPGAPITVTDNDQIEVEVVAGDAGDQIHGIAVVWTDPGPRNY